MKTCRELTEDASNLLGIDLAGPEWTDVREHLSRCAPCMEYVRQVGLTVEILEALPTRDTAATRAKLLALYTDWLASRS